MGVKNKHNSWSVVVFDIFLGIYRLHRVLLMLVIDRTEQGDVPRYSVYFVTLDRLGDRAVTSGHVNLEQTILIPEPVPSVSLCRVFYLKCNCCLESD